MGEYLEIL